MRLPLAIHAARQGYNWLNGDQHDLALLERFRRAIGKMPDIDYKEPLSCGALNVERWVVVYRFMVEKGGDFLGRDCLYLALTYFDRSVAASVHIARLLETPYFSTTLRDPPSAFEFTDVASMPCASVSDKLTRLEKSMIDFQNVGAAFQQPFVGILRIACLGASPQEACDVHYLSGTQSVEEQNPAMHECSSQCRTLNAEIKRRSWLTREMIIISLSVVVCVTGFLLNSGVFRVAGMDEELKSCKSRNENSAKCYPWMNVHVCWRMIAFLDSAGGNGETCIYCTYQRR